MVRKARLWRRLVFAGSTLLISVALFLPIGCHRNQPITIAVIPRTSGTIMWEPEHGGAQEAATKLGVKIYWNAPTREDDIQGQIALVRRIIDGNYQGLVLAPDHSLALITPVRSAISRGLPTVIVGSPLAIPPGDRLSYILNDDEAGGRIAAQRVATILQGHGSVAILGIDPDITGIMTRARSLEQYLAKTYPDLHVVVERMGSFNVPHEQQVAQETLKANPNLDAIIALTSTSTHGAISAIEGSPQSRAVKVIAFDMDDMRFETSILDSIVVQDTQRMGQEAIRLIVAKIHGERVPAIISYEPVLVTRDNVDTAEIREMTSMDWSPRHARWRIAP